MRRQHLKHHYFKNFELIRAKQSENIKNNPYMSKVFEQKKKARFEKMTNEQIEKIVESEKKLKSRKLTTRQHALKTWLEEHQQGKYWTIEEIIANVVDSEGNPYYTLNTSPYTHDKCAVLSADVRELNWHTGRERYIPIIKDTKGSIKLAESKQELEEYIKKEKAKVQAKYEYYNHLTSLIELEGTMPFINQANNVVDELTPIEVYAK